MSQTEPSRRLAAGNLLPARATSTGTRRRLLEQALILFGERGFHGVSVREIAEAAGIRASSIYAHLDSKQELLFELLMLGHEEHAARLRHAIMEASADPADQLYRVTYAHVLTHAKFPLIARVSNRELLALTPENLERVEAIREGSLQILMDVIHRGVEMGVFQVEDPWLAVAAIGAMGIRVGEWWERYPGYTPDQVAAQYAGFAVRIVTSGRSDSS